MAFERFRYDRRTEPALLALRHDPAAWQAFKALIASVKSDWEPAPEDEEPMFIVPFMERYVVFTRSLHDPGALLLAWIEPEPMDPGP